MAWTKYTLKMKYSINKIWCEKETWYENVTINSMNIKKSKKLYWDELWNSW
jgi:hypothetical protein